MNSSHHQRGITLVLLAVAMLALIAIAGLAIDVSHLVVDKARLQATADAAAVTGAKVLDNTGSPEQAAEAIRQIFAINAAQNPELAGARIRPRIQFSNNPNAFGFFGGGPGSQYVRVNANGFQVAASLSSALGFNTFSLDGNAVAGPSPTLNNACNVTPVMMCGTAATPGAPVYGYAVGQIIALQLSSGMPQATLGNYLTLSSGVNTEEQDFAGGYANCSAVANAPATSTGTGTVAVPAAQGLDTRFDEYLVGDLTSGQYPPDVIITQPTGIDRLMCTDATCATIVNGAGVQITVATQYPNFSYEGMYLPKVQAQNYDIAPAPGGIGVVNRRVLAVPVGDCTASTPVGGNVPIIGYACVYTWQDVDANPGDTTAGQIFGEVLQSCQVNGKPGPFPNNAPGPYSIQLYHVQGSPQS